MDSTRWDRLQALFEQAVDLPPDQWADYLEAREPDAEIRAEALAMLRSDADPDTLDPSAPEGMAELIRGALAEADSDAPGLEGRAVGPYRVLRRIGQGGMGAVYLAQREDVGNRVALKVVRGALGAPDLVRRFMVERRVLARLEHPHVARLLDAGMTPDETPFFAMEYVDGEPLTAYCQRHTLPVNRRLQLFRDVCDAVSYAHANLVVHRDIKPSNVLVTGDGTVKLLDFGIAKLLEDDEADASVTRTGARVLSPAYAAPEQVAGGPVTTATDVYSLGVLLYEILTGQRPLRDGDRTDSAPAAAEDAPRPSAVLARKGDGTAARRLSGDLDAICARAVATEPDRRYRSAEQLRDDISRHLSGMPVEARLPTFRYRAGKFLRRHAMPVAAAAALALSLGGGLGAALYQGQRAETARGDAELALQRSESVTGFLTRLFREADPNVAQGEQLTAVEMVDRGIERIDELEDDPVLQAHLIETLANVSLQLSRYDKARGLMERAVALRRQQPSDSSLVSALNIWGRAYSQLGHRDSAAVLTEEALTLSREVLGPEHPETLGLMNNLAIFYGRLNRDEEAESILREMIEIERRVFERDDPIRGFAINNLGLQLAMAGRYEESEPLLRESLRIRLASQGPEDLGTAMYQDNLAMMLRETGRFAEAEPLAREALEVRRTMQGEEHRYFGESLFSLGTLHAQRGGPDDLPAADSLLHAALGLFRTSLGDEHPATAYPMHSLGVLAEQQGDLRRAEQHHRMALELRLATQRDDGPRVVVRSMTALARVLRGQGRIEEARGVVVEAVDLARARLRPGHPNRLEARAELGLILAAAGQGGAEDFQTGLQGLAEVFPADHFRVRRLCKPAKEVGLGHAACGTTGR